MSSLVLFMFMTYHQIFKMRNMMGVTGEAGTAYFFLFSSPCQWQSELLPSLVICHPGNFSHLNLLLWNCLAKRTKTWWESSIEDSLLRLLISSRSFYKHGSHWQLLFLVFEFLNSSLKLLGQLNQNLVGSIYGKSSIKYLISSDPLANMAAIGNSCFWSVKL